MWDVTMRHPGTGPAYPELTDTATMRSYVLTGDRGITAQLDEYRSIAAQLNAPRLDANSIPAEDLEAAAIDEYWVAHPNLTRLQASRALTKAISRARTVFHTTASTRKADGRK